MINNFEKTLTKINLVKLTKNYNVLVIADFEILNFNCLYKVLEDLFGSEINLKDKKVKSYIQNQIDVILQEKKKLGISSLENKQKNVEKCSQASSRLLEIYPKNTINISKKNLKDSHNIKKKSVSGLHKEYLLSKELKQVVGIETSSRQNAVKLLWDFIKLNSLQSKENKKIITCNHDLQKLFKKSSVHMFEMNKLLNDHFFPIDETINVI